MEWLKMIIPLFGVGFGWFLAERAKIWNRKKDGNRKLKRLLFYLLELRFHLTREIGIKNGMNEVIDRVLIKYKDYVLENFNISLTQENLNDISKIKPHLLNALSNQINDENNLKYLEENIDKIIYDMSEELPLLAYDLSGKQNIRAKLSKAKGYVENMEQHLQEVPFSLDQAISPVIEPELLNDIDDAIRTISDLINKNQWTAVEEKMKKMDAFDYDDFDEFMDRLLEQVKSQLDATLKTQM